MENNSIGQVVGTDKNNHTRELRCVVKCNRVHIKIRFFSEINFAPYGAINRSLYVHHCGRIYPVVPIKTYENHSARCQTAAARWAAAGSAPIAATAPRLSRKWRTTCGNLAWLSALRAITGAVAADAWMQLARSSRGRGGGDVWGKMRSIAAGA